MQTSGDIIQRLWGVGTTVHTWHLTQIWRWPWSHEKIKGPLDGSHGRGNAPKLDETVKLRNMGSTTLDPTPSNVLNLSLVVA